MKQDRTIAGDVTVGQAFGELDGVRRIEFRIPAPPRAWQSVRMGKRPHKPAWAVQYQSMIRAKAVEARMVWERLNGKKWETTGIFRSTMVFGRGDRRRADSPNMDKLPSDAFSGVLYDDDSQVHVHRFVKLLAQQEPGTDVILEVICE